MTAYAIFSLIGWLAIGLWLLFAAAIVAIVILNPHNPERWL